MHHVPPHGYKRQRGELKLLSVGAQVKISVCMAQLG